VVHWANGSYSLTGLIHSLAYSLTGSLAAMGTTTNIYLFPWLWTDLGTFASISFC
jgi:hypothetical protein